LFLKPLFTRRSNMAAKKTSAKTTTTAKKTASPKKATTKKAAGKQASARKPAAKKTAAKKAKKMSALDAAAKVLGEAKEPLGTKEMVEKMAAKRYWTSPGGKTPHATLYSAITREINTKGKDARFKKTDRGQFAVNR